MQNNTHTPSITREKAKERFVAHEFLNFETPFIRVDKRTFDKFIDQVFDYFNQKEAAYRNECQEKISRTRLAMDQDIKSVIAHYIEEENQEDQDEIRAAMFSDLNDVIDIEKKEDDRLAELEAAILKYILSKGYKLEKDQNKNDTKWTFSTVIVGNYKQKYIQVILKTELRHETLFQWTYENLNDLFDKAFEFFKVQDEDLCDSCQTDKEKCFLRMGMEKVKACVKYEVGSEDETLNPTKKEPFSLEHLDNPTLISCGSIKPEQAEKKVEGK